MSRFDIFRLQDEAFKKMLEHTDTYVKYFHHPLGKNNKNNLFTSVRQVGAKKLNKIGFTLDEIAYLLGLANHTSVIYLLHNRVGYDLTEIENNFDDIITKCIYPVKSGKVKGKETWTWVRDYNWELNGK